MCVVDVGWTSVAAAASSVPRLPLNGQGFPAATGLQAAT